MLHRLRLGMGAPQYGDDSKLGGEEIVEYAKGVFQLWARV